MLDFRQSPIGEIKMIPVKKEKIYIEIVCRKSNIPTFQHFIVYKIYSVIHSAYQDSSNLYQVEE
jgi:hypothetical protein